MNSTRYKIYAILNLSLENFIVDELSLAPSLSLIFFIITFIALIETTTYFWKNCIRTLQNGDHIHFKAIKVFIGWGFSGIFIGRLI